MAALFLAACGDGSLRSPDLPPEKLVSVGAVTCSPPQIAVGQTASCQITGNCTYQRFDAEGREHFDLRTCPTEGVSFGSSNTGVATADNNGIVTGVSQGTTRISVTIDGVSTPQTPVDQRPVITVLPPAAACAQSLSISPQNASVVSGLSLPFTATVTFSNGTTQNVSTNPSTVFTSSLPIVTFNANNATAAADVATATPVTVTVTTTTANTCAGATLSANTSLTVSPAQLLPTGGLCIETVDGTPFTGCVPDTGACQTPTQPIGFQFTTPRQTRQLIVRGRFNDGRQCNLTVGTSASGTSPITTSQPGVVTVSSTGLATGVGVGTSALSVVRFGVTANRGAVVEADQVLGANSLAVYSQKLRDAQPVSYNNVQKFACVGANDVVINGLGGRIMRGFVELQARAKTCAAGDIDENGNCTAAPLPPAETGGEPIPVDFDNVELDVDVTNLAPAPGSTDPLADGIVWKSVPGYWNGREQGCVASGNPADTPAQVGDLFINPRALQFEGNGIPVNNPAQQPNGLAYADGAIRLGFSCVTATYTNPEDATNTVTDGMTMLVLPIVNDVLLGSSSDGEALCETLAPLFGGPLLGLVELTPLLNGITSNLNPTLLQQLDVIPLDDILTQVIGGLGGVTSPLIDALDDFLIDPVLEPAVCEITGVVNTLLGLLTGETPTQECN